MEKNKKLRQELDESSWSQEISSINNEEKKNQSVSIKTQLTQVPELKEQK